MMAAGVVIAVLTGDPTPTAIDSYSERMQVATTISGAKSEHLS